MYFLVHTFSLGNHVELQVDAQHGDPRVVEGDKY